MANQFIQSLNTVKTQNNQDVSDNSGNVFIQSLKSPSKQTQQVFPAQGYPSYYDLSKKPSFSSLITTTKPKPFGDVLKEFAGAGVDVAKGIAGEAVNYAKGIGESAKKDPLGFGAGVVGGIGKNVTDFAIGVNRVQNAIYGGFIGAGEKLTGIRLPKQYDPREGAKIIENDLKKFQKERDEQFKVLGIDKGVEVGDFIGSFLPYAMGAKIAKVTVGTALNLPQISKFIPKATKIIPLISDAVGFSAIGQIEHDPEVDGPRIDRVKNDLIMLGLFEAGGVLAKGISKTTQKIISKSVNEVKIKTKDGGKISIDEAENIVKPAKEAIEKDTKEVAPVVLANNITKASDNELKALNKVKKPKQTVVEQKPIKTKTSKVDETLLVEARKYKSAEEFVKAQGKKTGIEVRDKTGIKLQDPYTAEYLPINPDGTITVYHSTTKEGAGKIKQSGIFGSKTEGGDIYFTTNKKGYGGIGKDKDVVLAFNVEPKKVKFDDIYRGELHLKGNNSDIGGIKPVEIKTKSQLTDIWNKANLKTKPSTKPFVEQKPKPTAIKPKVKPTETKPKTNNIGKSRVFTRLQKENPEFLQGELPYDRKILKKEFDKAADRITKDKQKAYDIAMGREKASDIESVATNIELAEQALKNGDKELYGKLVRSRSIAQTRRGQALVAERGSVEDNSVARYVKELYSTRLEKLGQKYLSGLKKGSTVKNNAVNIIDDKVSQLDIQIKRGKLDAKTALKLLDELACLV